MGDDLSQPERWPVRTCMQWSDEPSGGFSETSPERLIHPIIHGGPFGIEAVNAVAQQRDPDSLFAWMRRLCDVRHSCVEIGWGEMSMIETDSPAILAHRYRWKGNSVILLHNLDERRQEVALRLEDQEAGELVDLFGNQVYRPNKGESRVIELDGYGYRWFRVARHD